MEYVSYRQGPYQIPIESAADRMVPALNKYKNMFTSSMHHHSVKIQT